MAQQMRPGRGTQAEDGAPILCGAERNLNDGWIQVERSTLQRSDRYVTENFLEFSGGFIEVRQMHWNQPLENVWSTTSRCYLVNMSLGADTLAAATNLSARRRHEATAVGRMFMVPPGQTMQCNARRGKSRSIRCALDAALVESFLPEKPAWHWDERRLDETLHLRSGEIEWLVRRMYREIQEPDFATPQVIEALGRQLAIEIVRKFELRGNAAEYRTGGLAPWRMRLIEERLHTGDAPPDLHELAGICDMTVRHLSRAFRVETGGTIGKHIEAVMVSRANAMLAAGLSVQEVAAALGYAKSGSFASAFRRATGLLPSDVKPGGRRGRAGALPN